MYFFQQQISVRPHSAVGMLYHMPAHPAPAGLCSNDQGYAIAAAAAGSSVQHPQQENVQ